MPKSEIDVLVSEVGPRDGLQSVKRTMPTAMKLEWLKALAAAGLREIEVGSFVSPKLLPQMADCADVVAGVRRIDGLTVLALVPNLKGAERAFAAGVHKVNLPVSASRMHSKSNINMTPEQAVEQVAAVCRLRASSAEFKHIGVEAGVATASDNTARMDFSSLTGTSGFAAVTTPRSVAPTWASSPGVRTATVISAGTCPPSPVALRL